MIAIILIDEYDTPLTSAYVSRYYNEAISFFRNLLSAAFKDNVALSFGQEKVYNPWSIINFINNKELGSYWINTSENQERGDTI